MARQARIKSEFGTYHIIQKGGHCRNLFTCNDDKDKFISILKNTQQKYDFILHSFCLLDDNSYDLVIDVNGGDLSKIMKSINIAYAMYTKCDGKLFIDRYKSYELESPNALHDIKLQINNLNISTDSNICYNMCFDEIQPVIQSIVDFEDCNNCITSISSASKKLSQIATLKGTNVPELTADKKQRNELIKAFRKNSTLSLKSLGELFGGISESSVSKILNS